MHDAIFLHMNKKQKTSLFSCMHSKSIYNERVRQQRHINQTQTNKIKNMSNEKNTKFTAAMTFNTDKVVIQDLRDKCKLGEKEMMRVILQVAMNHEPELIDAAAQFIIDANADAAAAKAAAKAAKEAVKLAAKAQRDAARAAAKVEREQAKAQAAAAKAAAKAQKELAKAAELADKVNAPAEELVAA